MYVSIIAPTYRVFYYFPYSRKIAEPSSLANSREERDSPAVDKYACPLPMRRPRKGKQRVPSPLHNMFFLISACIVLYRQRKSGHHFVAKVSKITAILNALICEKIFIYKTFYSSIFFNSTNSNTIFRKIDVFLR